MSRTTGQGGMMLPLTVGLLFVTLFFVAGAILAVYPGWPRSAALFFSIAGMLLVVMLSVLGSGAIMVSRIGSRPDEPMPLSSAAADASGSGPSGAPVSSPG
jgi:hypothetical protein